MQYLHSLFIGNKTYFSGALLFQAVSFGTAFHSWKAFLLPCFLFHLYNYKNGEPSSKTAAFLCAEKPYKYWFYQPLLLAGHQTM